LSTFAKEGLSKLKQNEPKAFGKAGALLHELGDHPKTGRGKPHMLSGDRQGQWSRRITGKHRMVYEILEEMKTVLVLSSYGHYDDK
jgi:toxin YoeB